MRPAIAAQDRQLQVPVERMLRPARVVPILGVHWRVQIQRGLDGVELPVGLQHLPVPAADE